MARLLVTDGETVETVSFNGAQTIVSREAVAMFRMGTKIYKILRDNVNSQGLENAWRKADTNLALPTPYEKVFHATYQPNDVPPSIDAIVIQMKVVDMTNFFQFSHGGEARLRGWINAEQDKERLKRIKRALESAKLAGLMDPQGVYSRTDRDPVLFFDIHTRGIPSNDFDGLINLIAGKL